MSALDTRIVKIQGKGVPVPGDDVDTDRIMPARYLRCVTFEHIGQYTFQDERFDTQGKPKAHPFNDPKYKEATILLVGKNFGCGSSREHAPQGILRWGIKAIVGESFAEIFWGNCTAIGLPAVTAFQADVKALMDAVAKDPKAEILVDLQAKQATCGALKVSIDMRESFRKMFLEGTWDTTATLMAAQDDLRRTAERLPYAKWIAA